MVGRLRAGRGGVLALVAQPGLGRSALVEYARAICDPVPSVRPTAPAALPREGPLLVCIDDAHTWCPAARSALLADLRRLPAESSVGVILTLTEHHTRAGELGGLATVRLGPLDDSAAAALLDRLTRGSADPVVGAWLIREAAGNPRLLSALVAALTPGQLSGRTPLPDPLPGGEAVLAAYATHIDELPHHTRALLLLAAAAGEHEPEGAGADLALLVRAAAEVGEGEGAGAGGGLVRLFRAAAGVREAEGAGFAQLLRAAADREHVPGSGAADLALLLGAGAGAGEREAGGVGADLAQLLRAGADREHEPGSGASGLALLLRAAGVGEGEAEGAGEGLAPLLRVAAGGEHGLRGGAADLALLLEAAAGGEGEPGGGAADRALLLRAAAGGECGAEGVGAGLELLLWGGCGSAGLAPAEAAGVVVVVGGRVHFTHPLLRRAVLHRAPLARRRAAHARLAAVCRDRLSCLVQLACAAGDHDARLAGALAAAATAPRPHAERSAALARAAALTADTTLRTDRLADAAEAARLAGDPVRARALLARTAAVPAHGGVHRVRGLLALADGPVADAREALLTAAALLPPEPARHALLAAAEAAWAMGDAAAYREAMARVPACADDPPLEAYRAGMCAVLSGRTSEGHALLRRCLDDVPTTNEPAGLLRAAAAALVVGEVESACGAGARALAAVRAYGPEVLLPRALEHLAYGELRAGRHTTARAHALEGLKAAHRTGQPNVAACLHAVLALAASVGGDAEACARHAAAAAEGAGPHGLNQAATLAVWAVARADLAAGRPGDAAARLAPLVAPGPRRGHFAVRMLAAPCFVEAAVQAGRTAEAHSATAEFTRWTEATADRLAPAQLARCRALLAPSQQTAAAYESALAHHDRSPGEFERARTQLLFGQWLRRRRRTREARGPLRDALVGFERCGARAWADRSRGELRAAGEAVAGEPGPGPGPLAALTPQQQRIARHVAEGATNREVAVRLSVSHRTVDHHLRNVFAALGVRSRVELSRLLAEDKGLPDRDEEIAAHL
nr:helix-turn-helix transcriptional regulator [Streptomyces sp. BA2]